MAIVLGHREPRWPSPTPFGTGRYHELVGGYTSGPFVPGFANDDAAGYSINIRNTIALYYYEADGTQITDGVWASGITAADFSGSPSTYWQSGLFMDADDNKLYMLVKDTASTPDKMKLCHVDKAGTLVQHAWQDMGTGMTVNSWCLQKDGSGNLFAIMSNEITGSFARGFKFHFAASDGALTTSYLIPAAANTMGLSSAFYPYIGPTDNDIYLRVRGNIATYMSAQGGGSYGQILNATTGKGSMQIVLPDSQGRGPDVSVDATTSTVEAGFYWRDYWLGAHYTSGSGNNNMYTKSDIHNFVDAVARDLGYL